MEEEPEKRLKVGDSTSSVNEVEENKDEAESNKKRNFEAVGVETHGKTTLDQCIRLFTKREQLSAENMWECSKCQTKVKAFREMQMSHLPLILVVHLKRFVGGREGTEAHAEREKIQTDVAYPVKSLDMSEYELCTPDSYYERFVKDSYLSEFLNNDMKQKLQIACEFAKKVVGMEQGKGIEKGKEEREGQWTPAIVCNPIYDLYAGINHEGTDNFGHYTAFGRNPLDRQWYRYDDSVITNISTLSATSDDTFESEQLASSNSYMLFYKRRGISWGWKNRQPNQSQPVLNHTPPHLPAGLPLLPDVLGWDNELFTSAISRISHVKEMEDMSDYASYPSPFYQSYSARSTIHDSERSNPAKLDSLLSPTNTTGKAMAGNEGEEGESGVAGTPESDDEDKE